MENERTVIAFRRGVVNELIKGAKDQVPGAARALDELSASDALPAELKTEIDRRAKGRGDLARRLHPSRNSL